MSSVVSVRCLTAFTAAVAFNCGVLHAQPVWQEQGDASEQIPGQETLGNDPLQLIQGLVESPGDCDLYRIFIKDPQSFRASTVGFAGFDTQLFLFDAHGNGITHNDDEVDGASTQSTITGQFVPRAAIYYLGISGYNRDPLNPNAALIWNNTPFRSERRPDGPGAPGPLATWMGTGAEGSYGIQLQGVLPSNGLWEQPYLRVHMDACPGRATVAWSNVFPNQQMALVIGRRLGITNIPSGVCGGTQLLLSGEVQLVRTLSSGPSGIGQIQGDAGAPACGRYLQLVIVDGDPARGMSCGVSNCTTITRGDPERCTYNVVCRTDTSDSGGFLCTDAREAVACAGALAWVGAFVEIAQICPPVEDCPTVIRGVLTWRWKSIVGITQCRYTARYKLELVGCGRSPNLMPAELAAPGACVLACPPW